MSEIHITLLTIAPLVVLGFMVWTLRHISRTLDEVGHSLQGIELGMRTLALVMVEDMVARGALNREEARALLAGQPLQPALRGKEVTG
ncbi:hypothetical protein LCGC14_2994280 [marine sediment metagenome]|uniref:Uncharacterized protein n=1 Tax=marine sediment metagenome TaxID=412755 RepID=A0A0F8X3D8_9ZZZZ